MTAQATSRNGGSALTGFVDDLNGAVRDNPIAAGLIGAGVVWMLFGGGRILGAAKAVTSTVGTAAAATGGAVGDAVAATGARVGSAARAAGDAIAKGTQDAAATVRDTVSSTYDALTSAGEQAADQAASAVRDSVRDPAGFNWDLGASLQVNLTQTLERQPLMLGAIGLAIGAAIASAFPSTEVEREMMGETGAAVTEKIKDIASETTSRAKQVLRDVKEEAAAQGLTPAAAMERAKDVAGKAKSAAGASREAIKGRLS